MFVDAITSMVGFQVCDQPHPLHVKNMVRHVLEGKFDDACSGLKQLYDLGYSPTDIITTLFRIIKNYDMAEYLKLEFMKVQTPCQPQYFLSSPQILPYPWHHIYSCPV